MKQPLSVFFAAVLIQSILYGMDRPSLQIEGRTPSSGGIIPLINKNGNAYIVLMQEASDGNAEEVDGKKVYPYGDISGKSEIQDGTIVATIIREFLEETIARESLKGSLDTYEKIANFLGENTIKIFAYGFPSRHASCDVTFVVNFDKYFEQLCQGFFDARRSEQAGKNRADYLAKKSIAIVEYSEFIKTVQNSEKDKHVFIKAKVISESGKEQDERILIRPYLVSKIKPYCLGKEDANVVYKELPQYTLSFYANKAPISYWTWASKSYVSPKRTLSAHQLALNEFGLRPDLWTAEFVEQWISGMTDEKTAKSFRNKGIDGKFLFWPPRSKLVEKIIYQNSQWYKTQVWESNFKPKTQQDIIRIIGSNDNKSIAMARAIIEEIELYETRIGAHKLQEAMMKSSSPDDISSWVTNYTDDTDAPRKFKEKMVSGKILFSLTKEDILAVLGSGDSKSDCLATKILEKINDINPYRPAPEIEPKGFYSAWKLWFAAKNGDKNAAASFEKVRDSSLYANYLYADLYFHGMGVRQDYAKAFQYYRLVGRESSLDYQFEVFSAHRRIVDLYRKGYTKFSQGEDNFYKALASVQVYDQTNLGIELQKRGLYLHALSLYQRVVELRPKDSIALDYLTNLQSILRRKELGY